MKKTRLRRWVKVVLNTLIFICGFMLLTISKDTLRLLIKDLICIFIMTLSFILLTCYGD